MISFKGNLVERESATKLMWQLSFHAQVAQGINTDHEMLDFIEQLGSTEDGPLSRSCNGIMWQTRRSQSRRYYGARVKDRVTGYVRDVTPKLLKTSSSLLARCSPPMLLRSVSSSRANRASIPNLTLTVPASAPMVGHQSRRARASSTPSEAVEQQSREKELDEKEVEPGLQEKQQSNGHIMISYNSKSRDLCLQIKKFLEALNYKVWIDVENISGSSLESMANAIENSICVLIC